MRPRWRLEALRRPARTRPYNAAMEALKIVGLGVGKWVHKAGAVLVLDAVLGELAG